MADHFYSLTLPGGVKIGGNAVTKGTSTAGGNFELRVTDAVTGNSKEKVLEALRAIEAFITTDNAPA